MGVVVIAEGQRKHAPTVRVGIAAWDPRLHVYLGSYQSAREALDNGGVVLRAGWQAGWQTTRDGLWVRSWVSGMTLATTRRWWDVAGLPGLYDCWVEYDPSNSGNLGDKAADDWYAWRGSLTHV